MAPVSTLLSSRRSGLLTPVGVDSSASVRNRNSELPIWISSPSAKVRSRTGTPLTKLPLRLSRSRISYCPSRETMTQCCREREGSLTDKRLDGFRPTENSV